MSRYIGLIFLLIVFQQGKAQRLISKDEAVQLAFNNQRNLKTSNLFRLDIEFGDN